MNTKENTNPEVKVGDILFFRGETSGFLKVEEIREENGEIRYYETSRNLYLIGNDPNVLIDKVCSVETKGTKLIDSNIKSTDTKVTNYSNITKENKELLLKDLSGRLLYGVKMNHIANDKNTPKTLIGIAKDMITLEGMGGYECVDIEDYKPYLLPLSSMTDEQKIEYDYLHSIIFSCYEDGLSEAIAKLQDFYNKNHLDYRGLIPMGLAKDATELCIY